MITRMDHDVHQRVHHGTLLDQGWIDDGHTYGIRLEEIVQQGCLCIGGFARMFYIRGECDSSGSVVGKIPLARGFK